MQTSVQWHRSGSLSSGGPHANRQMLEMATHGSILVRKDVQGGAHTINCQSAPAEQTNEVNRDSGRPDDRKHGIRKPNLPISISSSYRRSQCSAQQHATYSSVCRHTYYSRQARTWKNLAKHIHLFGLVAHVQAMHRYLLLTGGGLKQMIKLTALQGDKHVTDMQIHIVFGGGVFPFLSWIRFYYRCEMTLC